MISYRISFTKNLCQIKILELIITTFLKELGSKTTNLRSWIVPSW